MGPDVRPARARGRRTRWIWIGVGAVVLVLGVVAGVVAKGVYDGAQRARAHLVQAVEDARAAKAALLGGDQGGAAAAVSRFTEQMTQARRSTEGFAWSIAESVPLPVAANLRAVRVVTESGSTIADSVSALMTDGGLSAIEPKDGAWDLPALARTARGLADLDRALAAATDRVEDVRDADLVPEVASGVSLFREQLAGTREAVGSAADVLGMLPDALGASGPRDYLLMFQGNSEARSLGGNAAVMLPVHAEQGRVSIGGAVNSSDFVQPRATPVIPLDPEAVHIYGDKIGRYTPDLTMIPDFPQAVTVAQGWWRDTFGVEFDAALSVDPVALSYLLRATGPIVMPTGDTLTAENAVPLLLNEVYFRYEDPAAQNDFFAAAADSVFGALTRGGMDTGALVEALTLAAAEGRILYASSDASQERLVEGSRIGGRMPADNAESAVLGVYLNDDTGSKKSYYLDMTIEACSSGSAVEGRVQLTSTLTADQAAGLPHYVRGVYFPAPDISSYVVLYGPVGTTLAGVTMDGQPAVVSSAGQHLGRPAVKVHVMSHLSSVHTIDVRFEGLGAEHGPLDVWSTPMSRATPVAVAPACAD